MTDKGQTVTDMKANAMLRKTTPLRASVVALMAAGILMSACSKRDVILPGERHDLRTPLAESQAVEGADEVIRVTREQLEASGDRAERENRSVAFSAPATVNHSSWTHRNGSASHRVQHPAFDGTTGLIWSADIGAGNSRRYQITADPVVADGRIFTLDSRTQLVATATNGARIWSKDMTPGFDNNDAASGGGLAVDGETLYVTTGFGTVVALNTATGDEIWTQRLEGAATGVPTVQGALVYVVSRDGKAWAIDKTDGRVQWSIPGIPSESGVSGGAGPAVNAKIAIFPYASGDLSATFPRGGVRMWAASLAGQRRGRVYAEVVDITGDPVIDGNRVYAGSSSGRIAALDATSGERIWTATDGAMNPVWPSGDSVFAVSDQAELLRLDAATGERIWSIALPYFEARKTRRRDSVYPHFGPVLAGGRVMVASGDGLLRSFAPEDGRLLSETPLSGGAASTMAVVDGTLYVVSSKGQLLAYR